MRGKKSETFGLFLSIVGYFIVYKNPSKQMYGGCCVRCELFFLFSYAECEGGKKIFKR